MSNRTLGLSEALHDYLLDVSVREHPLLAELRAETASLDNANMQIAPEQGQFMGLLARMLGATRCLEVGTFTGYSSLAVALAVPGASLTCCDVNEDWTAMARRYWKRAGVADRIDLRLAPAMDTLDALLADGAAGTYDFAFLDADKTNYDAYYERSLQLLRPGGLVAIDNVLWGGKVVDGSVTDPDTEAIRALNRRLKDDDRVDLSLVPIADGLTLARKVG